MRVLWFTNTAMPAVLKDMGLSVPTSGYWMSALLEEMREEDGVKLGVVTALRGYNDKQFTDGVDYFVIGERKRFPQIALNRNIQRCAQIVQQWKPDIIHIHGTENFYGLIKSRNMVEVPVAVSIQGLLGPCAKRVFGSLSWREIIKAHKLIEIITGLGIMGLFKRYRRDAVRENEIIQYVDAILGRTEWDKAHVWSIAPKTPYFHVGRILRKGFYTCEWKFQNCKRHGILMVNARNPMRGLDTVLKAVKILRHQIPDVSLAVAAGLSKNSGYGRYIRKKISTEGLSDAIELLGFLNEGELTRELLNANVFVIASHIENSPNSLCEAQLVGLPCIASFAGGIPSLVEDGVNGLLFQDGDAETLAYRLRSIFVNDELAINLGKNARENALRRHNPETIIADLLNAYDTVFKAFHTT